MRITKKLFNEALEIEKIIDNENYDLVDEPEIMGKYLILKLIFKLKPNQKFSNTNYKDLKK